MPAGLAVYRGVVKAVNTQIYSGRVDQKTGHVSLNSVPEIWLRLLDGREHRFSDELLAEVAVGHEVALVFRLGKNDLLRVVNVSTQQNMDSWIIVPVDENPGSRITNTLQIAAIGAVIGLFVFLTIAGNFSLGGPNGSMSGILAVFGAILTVVSYWLAGVWMTSSSAKARRLRNQVEKALMEQSLNDANERGEE